MRAIVRAIRLAPDTLIGGGPDSNVHLVRGHGGKLVVIKVAKPGDELNKIYILNEARVLAGLNHPNIVKLYGSGKTRDGRPFITLEYVEGRSIEKGNRLPLSLRLALEVTRDIAKALEYLHSKGLYHGDVKPGNILVSQDGKSIKLTDLAYAGPNGTWPEGEKHVEGERPGTAEYNPFSASSYRGWHVPPKEADDINALGLVLYEMITNRMALDIRKVYNGEFVIIDPDSLRKNYDDFFQRVLNSDFPPLLKDLLLRMTGFFGEEKIPTASEVIASIDPFLSNPGG
jgi:serine/threonine-protein kinase